VVGCDKQRSSGLYGRVIQGQPDVSEEHIASIFRVEAKQKSASSACRQPSLVSRFAYSSTLKMELICSFETLSFHRTIRRYNPDDHTLHRHRCENFRSTEIGIIMKRRTCGWYSKCPVFEPRHEAHCEIGLFSNFPQTLQKYAGNYLKLGHIRFVPILSFPLMVYNQCIWKKRR
jgi:hypothetical protein